MCISERWLNSALQNTFWTVADCRIILVFGFVCLFFKPSYGWFVFCVCFLTLRDAVLNILILTYRKYFCPYMQVLMNSTFSSEYSLCTSGERLANHCPKQPGLNQKHWQSAEGCLIGSLFTIVKLAVCGYWKMVIQRKSSAHKVPLLCFSYAVSCLSLCRWNWIRNKSLSLSSYCISL